ncbi:TPA: hypothetical protein OBN97_002529 [Escherichia coli]|nr:hypothetical protein [Escherichia coli]
MTSKLTRDRLQEIAEDGFLKHGESKELARMALAAMDSEPVAWAWHYREQWHVTNDERRAEFVAKDGDVAVLPLYRHAQSAQISEPVLPLQDKDLQGVIDALEHPAGINAAGKQVVRHALVEIQERRKADREPVAEVVSIYGDTEAFGEREIRPLVGIQQMPYGTKLYRHAQPAQVVPEEMTIMDACKFVQDMRLFDDVSVIVMRTWNACRATMLQASPVCTCPSGDGSLRWPCPVHPGNSPAIPDGLPDGVNIYHGPKEKTILVLKQGVAVNQDCWCRTCRPVTLNDMRFVVCPDCGNKRCPRANDHRNACTGSNEPGQEGSAYPDTLREVK